MERTKRKEVHDKLSYSRSIWKQNKVYIIRNNFKSEGFKTNGIKTERNTSKWIISQEKVNKKQINLRLYI